MRIGPHGQDGCVLGLPDDVAACLFDLDGVLTDTAAVHAAAWTEMFDEFLKDRAERVGGDVRAVRPRLGLRRLRRRASRARTACGTFLAAAASSCPTGRPDDPPTRETVHGLGNRKNELLLRAIDRDGVQVFEGSRALPGRGQGRPGCAGRWSRRAPTPGRSST